MRAPPLLKLLRWRCPCCLQVFVQVDEVGTEAAAVTSVIMTATAALEPPPVPKVVFDRPFLFNIVDDASNTVLFQGWVTDPSKSIK
jgi:serpin B